MFDGWSMGFKNLGNADLTVTPGYSEFLDAPLTAAEFGENPAASQRLLLSFKAQDALTLVAQRTGPSLSGRGAAGTRRRL